MARYAATAVGTLVVEHSNGLWNLRSIEVNIHATSAFRVALPESNGAVQHREGERRREREKVHVLRLPIEEDNMKVGAPLVALITGAGSGIGRALALALAKRGVQLSLVDFSESAGLETVRLVQDEYSKLGHLQNLRAIFIKCDVTQPEEIFSVFQKHEEVFGRLDICINSAGISERGQLFEDRSNDGTGPWRKVLDVNLIAVIDCTRLAVQVMLKAGKGGTVLNVASAAGLYPSFDGPAYSSSKGGVTLFSRSLAVLMKKKIRVNAICPEFVETDMTRTLGDKFIEMFGGYVPMELFLQGAFLLLEDDRKAGECLWISNRCGIEYWPTAEEKKKYMLSKPSKTVTGQKARQIYNISLPNNFRKLIVHKLSNRFRDATKIVSVPFGGAKDDYVLVKLIYAGVNASDVNYTAGLYFGSKEKAVSKLPFDAGFEAVGIIAAVGKGVTREDLFVGAPVATLSYGGFSEFSEVLAAHAIPVPVVIPEIVPMLTSGLTALLGLEEAGKMGTGETVLVTAAAGGTGQFAVQLAKLAGNKVVATCGGAEKASLLKELGADRVIDYRTENVSEVLKREFPKGVDLVYESVGGEMFQTCLNALGVFGRLVIIGMVSQYQNGESWERSVYHGLCEKLLWKSQTLVGFFLNHHVNKWHPAVQRLYKLYNDGKLKVAVDPTAFKGLEAVADAVEHLHSGHSIGKVVVQIQSQDMAYQSRL
ncbi:hypothetical protein GOP47_0011050 [Adiantum capillus-veneris]|uniref:Enoyl reductase (ER) domain-containing protein n=1 Tax=Adiantum capillus-veneris TaxID=13818 RepID=A0A9D4USJ0_ADICA|nr:hypothetical protein GOP47_0011050 [Adiantum capillus-veneris]